MIIFKRKQGTIEHSSDLFVYLGPMIAERELALMKHGPYCEGYYLKDLSQYQSSASAFKTSGSLWAM